MVDYTFAGFLWTLGMERPSAAAGNIRLCAGQHVRSTHSRSSFCLSRSRFSACWRPDRPTTNGEALRFALHQLGWSWPRGGSWFENFPSRSQTRICSNPQESGFRLGIGIYDIMPPRTQVEVARGLSDERIGCLSRQRRQVSCGCFAWQ